MSKSVLVSGATSKQGGSVINARLKQNANFEILALTRNATSESAQRLAKKSPKIKLITGNLDDPQDIFRKIRAASQLPVWGVFSVQAPAIGSNAVQGSEERQGKALIDAALENGVKHFVYSSVDRGGAKSDDNPTDVPHFISKHNIEKHLYQKTTDNAMSWTVLRLVAFFENLVPGFVGKIFATSFDMILKKDHKLQLIATSDIGYFAAQSLMKPDQYKNRKLSLAGDELTSSEFKSVFEKTMGQTLPTTYWVLANILHWAFTELGTMFRWFRDVGYGADIASLKEMNPGMKDFATWLKEDSHFRRS